MRVAFDISATRGHKTGIGVYTADFIAALNEFAPHIETISLDDGADVTQRTDRRIFREQFTLPRLAAQTRADLLHLTGFAAPLYSSIPVVLTVMDLIGVLFSENFPPASRLYWSRYLPFSVRAARHIITLSENTKSDLIRLTHTPSNRITVIPPGVDARFRVIDESFLLREAQAQLKLPPRFFLFVSTLEPRKGIDTLLSAYSGIASKVSEHLLIVGKRGWYHETLFAQVHALGLQDRVHVADYLPAQDLPFVYNLATALVFPSRYEGFGLVPLEAMACGTPVISSHAASLPEVIGDAGILLAPEDVYGFSHAMMELASNKELCAQLRACGLRRAGGFSWGRAVDAVSDCYSRVLRA